MWFVSLLSFNWWDDQAAQMQTMLDELKRQAGTLHEAPRVVIDVRGNTGGNSQWGQKVASALWGEKAVSAIVNSFDQTVDWRASVQNAKLTRAAAARSAAAGLAEDAKGRNQIADEMDVAVTKGNALFTAAELPTSPSLPKGYASPFKGKVFFLTDMRCASACLGFADIVTRMPGGYPCGSANVGRY
ncbi:S41 family peptidase [Gluconobacter japonicus]|uniref:S41 family peptidase n=1 Tax=Gluconobacter japonicus TaxID=376620 RepID=UPI0024ACC041|nr:S41 family peptidase [Gluconobacter japonicus]MDI6652456.1 S41 family peptidase [Gluconobacter japonicus]